MKTRLAHLWEMLVTSYWFVPSIMLVAAAAFAIGILWLDVVLPPEVKSWAWLYSGGSAGARSLLSTVAGSVMTVAGVVFSITIMILAQASSQFGPRLLRTFMRDTGNQVVLGTFLSTFLYCLLVLRRVYGPDNGGFVPHIAVTVAVLLAIASMAVLIYYIHHISTMLQASNVVAAMGQEFDRAIERAFPHQLGAQGGWSSPEPLPPDFESTCLPVLSTKDGYIQALNADPLMKLAVKHDLLVRLDRRPGQYVMKGHPLLHVWPGTRCSEELASDLDGCFFVGWQRTSEQDIEFAVNQMVEIAVRALSPGINDPFTAMTCIDWLGEALSRVALRPLPGPNRYDDDGKLRVVVASISTFPGLVDAAFNQIRQYSTSSVAVKMRLLEMIGEIGRNVDQAPQKEILQQHLEMIHRQTRDTVEPLDRKALEERYDIATRLVNSPLPTGISPPISLSYPAESRCTDTRTRRT